MPEDLKRIIRSYDDLLQTFSMMSSQYDTDSLLEYIIQSSERLMKATNTCLFLCDNGSRELYVKMATGDKKKNLESIRIKSGKGIAGWVAQHGESLTVADVKKEPLFFEKIDETTGFTTKNVVALPLKLGDRILGVLEVLNVPQKILSAPQSIKMLTAFAQQAAISIDIAQIISDIKLENHYLHEQIDKRYHLVSNSEAMSRILETAAMVAQTDSTVLITGESGTGKELIAQHVHKMSGRRNKPFLAVNCASLSEQLLESELFGYEKGAFTGAQNRKIGKLEAAKNGTFLFDEIGEMKISLQAKLLRFLQERTFERVGGNESIEIDVRIICCTHRDLLTEVKNGNFREDLYYRLNVIPLVMPPLRERKEEIPNLTHFFIERYCRSTGQELKTITKKALTHLMKYNWPGNVRELENIVERIVVLCHTDTIDEANIPLDITQRTPTNGTSNFESLSFKDALIEKKRDIIRQALAQTDGNQKEAATSLDMQPTYLSKLIKDLEI